jgi:Ca2+-binding RTX toxin-like protein
MVGGSGNDTLIGGTGPDTMTGAAGADRFMFRDAPWQAGHITDFTHGTDKIDVAGMLAKVGWSGTNAIIDGYIKLIDDGHGDTWVYFDRDGPGAADQWGSLVTTLDHVSPGTLTASDWIFK